MNVISSFFSKEKVIFYTYLIVGLALGLVFYFQGPRRFNNFIIFRQSFFHLLDHKNLFTEYPAEYFDIFLYHPTFCLLFSPFSLLPVPLSLVLWSVGCALIMFYGIKSLPIPEKEKVFFWWVVIIELATTLHSQQTNSIIAALGLFTFAFLEKNKPKWAALFPIIAFCIKGYGLIFAGLFLFYPKPWKYILYSTGWLVLFAFLPLPVAGMEYFVQLYSDWINCLTSDHAVNFGYSIMGLIQLVNNSFTDSDVTKVQYAGLILFTITWIWNLYSADYRFKSRRMLLLAYTSLWVILFNHASEPPTFIIAAQGVALFYVVGNNMDKLWPKALVVFFVFFSIVAHKDIYPPSWPVGFVPSLVAKTVPCLIILFVLQIQLFLEEEKRDWEDSPQPI